MATWILALVTLFSYLTALYSVAAVRSDVQLIATGVFATCGTIALVGLILLNRMTALAALRDSPAVR